LNNYRCNYSNYFYKVCQVLLVIRTRRTSWGTERTKSPNPWGTERLYVQILGTLNASTIAAELHGHY